VAYVIFVILIYKANKEEIIQSTVQYSFSHAWRIGDTISRARATKQSPVEAMRALENGMLVVFE